MCFSFDHMSEQKTIRINDSVKSILLKPLTYFTKGARKVFLDASYNSLLAMPLS